MKLHLTPRISSAFTAALILGAVLFSLPSAAMAQASPAPAPAAKATRSDRVEARIKSLHDTLKITSAEEPQWQAVADVMRDNAKTTGTLIQQRAANAKTMTAVDDLNSYAAIADAHATGVKKLATAFTTLYASLSDPQKKLADAAFLHRPRPRQAKKLG
jgi:protein CpxP